MEKNKLQALVGVTLMLTLAITSMIAVSPEAKATDFDGPGYALIAAPQFGLDSQVDEAKNLRNYLIDHGWSDERIIFLADLNESYVDGDATKSEIENATNEIALSATSSDLVFIGIMDHAQEIDGHSYFRTGDVGDPTYIKDTEFANWVDDIQNFETMVIYISSPYSGGFVSELEGNYRIVISDCGENQTYTTSEYTFYEALTEPQADSDGDGKISVEEAYTWMEDYMQVQDPVIYDYQKDDEVFL